MWILCTKLVKNYNRKLETKATKEAYLNIVSYIQILDFSILHKDDICFMFSLPNDFSSLLLFYKDRKKKKNIIIES